MSVRACIRIILSIAVFAVFIAPQTAHADNFLYRLFPHVFGKAEKEQDPGKTLVAPFADSTTKVSPEARKDPLSQLTEQSIPLDQPHRTDKEISKIISNTVAEMFMIDYASYESKKKEFLRIVTPNAIAQYDAFLRGSGILRALESNSLRLNNFVEARPVMLGKGVYGGVYRWLFEVPVLLTLLDRNATTYSDARAESHAVIVRLQIARVANGQNTNGFVIETVEVKQRKKNPTAP